MTKRGAIGILIGVTILWGTFFTVIKMALFHASPLLFMGVRFLTASALLAPVFPRITREEWHGGAVLGAFFAAGAMLQSSGLVTTTPARSAFITSICTPLVPLASYLAFRVRPRPFTLVSIAIAMFGTYLLTSAKGGSGGLNHGDFLTLIAASVFAGHVVAVSHYASRFRPLHLLAVQLLITGVASLLSSPLLETPRFEFNAIVFWTWLGLSLSAIVTFGLQLVAQRTVSASRAAVIFLLEPLVASFTSYLVFGERLGAWQWIGGGLILAAMLEPLWEAAEIL